MKRSDIMLALLIIGVLVALAIAVPYLLDTWRATESTPADEVSDMADGTPQPDGVPVEDEEEVRLDAQTAAELERVSGMLMLHRACANRFHGFDAEGRDTVERWKHLHADLLARRGGAEPDFHIVLAEPEAGQGQRGDEQAEERGLCERNLEAMRTELTTR